MPKVKIGDDLHEVSIDDIQLEDGKQIIDPSNPPSGLFTQKALDEKIQQRLSKEPDKVKSRLKEDKEFHKEILSMHNISLDEEGNPKGLEPDFDPQKWIENKSKEITKPLKDELENFKTKYERAKKARIEDAILASTKGVFKEEFTTPKDEGRVKPIVVNQFRELFDENDNGVIALKDSEGHFAVDGNGQPITPSKYLSNQDKFGDWMVDKRQRGTGFQNGANGSKTRFSEDQIAKMSDKEYEQHRDEIHKAAAEGRVD